MKTRLVILTAAASIMIAAAAHAHHSFSAEFDREQSVEFSGVVTKIDWTNPHARFYVDGKDPAVGGDEIFHWNIELVSASVLMRQGWRHDSLQVGDVMTVTASRARKDAHVVNASVVTDASGKRMFSRIPEQARDNE